MAQSLSPKRRFLSALFGGRRGDRPPVGNPTSIVTLELMEKTGIYFPQAHLDPMQMAELAAAAMGFSGSMPSCPNSAFSRRLPPWGARWTGEALL